MKKNNAFVAVLLLTVAGNMYGMEQGAFPFTALPQELQQEIMVIALNNEINRLPNKSKSLDVAAQKIRDLTSVNKKFNDAINNTHFCLKLIKNLADRFSYGNDQDAAKALATKCAHERLKLQEEFSDFCFEETFSIDAFEKFYKRGVDLDWISLSRTQTELSKAIDSFKLDLVKAFVKYGANVNRPYDVGTKVPTLLDLIIYNGEHIARTAEQKKKAIEMIKTFVNAGADVDKVTSENKESEIFKRALAEMGRK